MSKGDLRDNFKIQVGQDFKLNLNKENKEDEERVCPIKKVHEYPAKHQNTMKPILSGISFQCQETECTRCD